MKLPFLIAPLMCLSLLAHAQQPAHRVVASVEAPGGRTTYYIMSPPGRDASGNPNMTIEAGINGNSSFKVLLSSLPSRDPKSNLTDLSRLFLSPDGRTLFFESSAWATSGAVHSLDIATGAPTFVAPGRLACVVLAGKYQGDLIVEQHRYFVQGGSYDSLYLFDSTGKEIGLVSQDRDEARVCPLLGM